MKHIKSGFWFAFTQLLLTFPSQSASAACPEPEPAILIIGASYANGSTPFNDALQAPLGGIYVNFGSYLSVGNAIVRNPLLAGFVVNEAQSGATTFDRLACGVSDCGPAAWQGYDTQLAKALARVAVPDPQTDGHTLRYNADHVIISLPNDCFHSDAFGVPQEKSVPCDPIELDAIITKLIAVGQKAISFGIIPIFEAYPEWTSLDFPLMEELFQFAWTIDRQRYEYLRNRQLARVERELPGSILVNPWHDFVHIGDGIHPSPATARQASWHYARAIIKSRCR